MGRLKYINQRDFPRESALDQIIHVASMEVLSAKINKDNVEYVVTLTDAIKTNLPEQPLTFSFTIDPQQRRVTSIEKTTAPMVPDLSRTVTGKVLDVLGNDLDELCFRIEIDDPYLDQKKEFDVLIIGASREIEYSDLDDDDSPTQVEKSMEEES